MVVRDVGMVKDLPVANDLTCTYMMTPLYYAGPDGVQNAISGRETRAGFEMAVRAALQVPSVAGCDGATVSGATGEQEQSSDGVGAQT